MVTGVHSRGISTEFCGLQDSITVSRSLLASLRTCSGQDQIGSSVSTCRDADTPASHKDPW